MIRILHTADVHLDSPLRSLALRDAALGDRIEAATRDAFGRIVDTAIAERCAALLIAGDLFDGQERSARTAAFLTGAFDRLRDAGVAVYMIKGNHDAENPVTGALDLPDNVHVFDARGGKVQLADDVWIHGVSFSSPHAPDSLLPRFSAPVPGAVNIALLHTSLAGAPGHDPYAPCTLADLRGMGFDYWALGHIHKRQVHDTDPWIVIPGMPQGRDIGEAGPKSATLLTVAEGRITTAPVPTAEVAFASSLLEVARAATDEDLRAAIRAHMRDLARALDAPQGVVRLVLTGAPDRHWQILRDADIWREHAGEAARETGRLWLDKLVLDLDPPGDGAADGDATAALAQIMDDIAAEAGHAAAGAALLDALAADLPASVRARLLPDAQAAPSLVEAASKDGAQRVLARLKGAAG